MSEGNVFQEIVNGAETVTIRKSLHEVITEDGKPLIMTRKEPLDGAKHHNPVMLVHGLGQNRFSWHLSRRSMENFLVRNGFEVFNVELRGHGLSRAAGSDAPENFEAYVRYDIPAFIRSIQDLSGKQKTFYIGHSLGGIISYCLGVRHRNDLAGIVSIAGPFDFGKGNLPMKLLAKIGKLLSDRTPLFHLHPSYFYVDFLGMFVTAGLFYLDHPWNHFPFNIWHARSTERDLLEERIKKGFDRTSITVFELLVRWAATGHFLSTDKSTDYSKDLRQLDLPILFVVGDRDAVVPPVSVEEGFRIAASKDKTFKLFNPTEHGGSWGHCDLICGDRAPKEVWPFVLDWLVERDWAPPVPKKKKQSPRRRKKAA